MTYCYAFSVLLVFNHYHVSGQLYSSRFDTQLIPLSLPYEVVTLLINVNFYLARQCITMLQKHNTWMHWPGLYAFRITDKIKHIIRVQFMGDVHCPCNCTCIEKDAVKPRHSCQVNVTGPCGSARVDVQS